MLNQLTDGIFSDWIKKGRNNKETTPSPNQKDFSKHEPSVNKRIPQIRQIDVDLSFSSKIDLVFDFSLFSSFD